MAVINSQSKLLAAKLKPHMHCNYFSMSFGSFKNMCQIIIIYRNCLLSQVLSHNELFFCLALLLLTWSSIISTTLAGH